MLGMGGDPAGARVRGRHGAGVGAARELHPVRGRAARARRAPGAGIRIGLVTNGQRDLDEFVRHHRLHVDAMVGSKAHGRIKPHPSIFVAALRQLEVAPAIGDGQGLLRGRHRGCAGARDARDLPRPRRPAPASRTEDRHAAGATRRPRARPLARVARLPCGRPAGRARRLPESRGGRGLRPRPHGADAHVLPVEQGRATRRGRGPRGSPRVRLRASWSSAYCRSAAPAARRARRSRLKNFGSSAPTVTRRPSAVP